MRAWIAFSCASVAGFVSACAQIGELDCATSCARIQPEEVRSAIARDLCQQFGERGSVQLYGNGNTLACPAAASKPLVRMFVASKDAPSPMNGRSVASIYLLPWKAPAEIVIHTSADHMLAKEVTRAIEQSLGKSGSAWVMRQRTFTDPPKLG